MNPIAALALPLALLALQDAPDPHRPAPAFDSVAPDLPALGHPAVLIFSKTNSFRHDSIPDAVRAVAALAARRGWSTFASENAAIFNADQLARFDLIVFASATGDMFTPAQRAAFEQWVATGHGFVGLHGAGDGSHPDWYQAMLGYSGYTGHPGGGDQFQTGDLVIVDRGHPATRKLPRRWRWAEEYYAYQGPFRPDIHVLARLDEKGMRLEPRHRMGAHHNLIWWRCEGPTRVFYSALGHKPETWSDANHLAMLDGALGWAMKGKDCRLPNPPPEGEGDHAQHGGGGMR